MKKTLPAIITASLLALGPLKAQAEISDSPINNSDTLKYRFKAASKVPVLNLVSLLTGYIKYYKNSNEIYGEINPTGGLAKLFNREIKHRTYSTIFYPDSIVYIRNGDSLDSDSFRDIRKSLSKKSPYFDVLTSVSILLDYIEKDSLEYHKLIKEGTLTLFIDNKIISAELSSLEYEKIKYREKEVLAKKLSIKNCPDERTFFEIIIYNKKVIKVHCLIKRGLGINLNAELEE
ncbi:MAG: hypothetical protein ACPLXC_01925 [Candidatus Pacearchaeota archaeon]